MQKTTLILELRDNEIRGLLALCQSGNRSHLAKFCESQEEASALSSALDEIAWQLASSGHEGAIETLSTLDGR